jgi:tetratricopeptide (TPR) repeat protein
LAKKDAKNAIVQFELVSDPKSPSFAQAVYRAGEAYIDLGVLDKAIAKLILFRDKQEFQNESGLTDRALLRLGVAYSLGKQWDAARQANDVLAQRFAGSPWIHEARYNIGWARQNLQQYEEAVAAYQQVVNATTTELAAKAQLQIGLCRLEQKRFAEAAAALLIVPNTFDFPELSAAALCEASRCYVELKNREQAERLLLRVVRDHAASDWAKVAQERLELLRKNTGT